MLGMSEVRTFVPDNKLIIMQRTLSILTLILFTGLLAFGQDDGHHDDQHKTGHGSHHHKHHMALFNGATTSFGHHFTAYSTGLDYEYRLADFFGTGFMAEVVHAATREYIAGIPFFIHPYKGFKIIAAPVVMVSEHQEIEVVHHKAAETTNEQEAQLGVRLGVGYDFHLGRFSAGPVVNYDFINNMGSAVYGISIGIGL